MQNQSHSGWRLKNSVHFSNLTKYIFACTCCIQNPVDMLQVMDKIVTCWITYLFSLCQNAHLFSKRNMSTFSLTLDKCHKTSRIFTRTEQTFVSARSFGVIFCTLFLVINGPLGLGGRPQLYHKALLEPKGFSWRK